MRLPARALLGFGARGFGLGGEVRPVASMPAFRTSATMSSKCSPASATVPRIAMPAFDSLPAGGNFSAALSGCSAIVVVSAVSIRLFLTGL